MNSVRRNLSDFDFFHEQLLREFPYILVPPVPEKKGTLASMLSSESDTLIAYTLQLFLARVTRHPTLAKSNVCREFFELADDVRG